MALRPYVIEAGENKRVILATLQRCIHDFEIVRIHPKDIDEVSRGQMVTVRAAAFRVSLVQASVDMRSFLEDYDNAYLVIQKNSERVIGFAMNRPTPDKIGIIFSTTAMDPEFQGLGLYGAISRLRIMEAVASGASTIHITAINPETQDMIKEMTRRRLKELFSAGIISFFNTEIYEHAGRVELTYNVRR